ncbi:hypothetical protein D3Z53_17120 [Lachnospiraceae bacterium]|nr:hypothetical protein [Lachnospiraceae bacterium]
MASFSRLADEKLSCGGSVIWGIVCDRFQTNRKVSVACFLTAGFVMYAIFFSEGNRVLLAMLYPILGFVALPHAVNIDSWLLLACKNDLSIYGKIRCTPSIMYAVTSVVLGRLIAAHGYFLMPFFRTFFLMTGIAAALMLPEGEKVIQDHEKNDMGMGSVKQVFHSASYRYLIVLLFLIGLAIAPMNHLKTAILENVGGTVSDIGIDGFISAITQVPFIACADKIEKLPLRIRYLLVTGLPFTAYLLAYYAVSPVMVFAGSGLINFGIGILLPTMRSVTESSVSPAFRNLGHNIADTVFNSVTGILSLVCSGIVLSVFGVKSMLGICIVIILAAVILAAAKGKRK